MIKYFHDIRMPRPRTLRTLELLGFFSYKGPVAKLFTTAMANNTIFVVDIINKSLNKSNHFLQASYDPKEPKQYYVLARADNLIEANKDTLLVSPVLK